jgi:hypothetical protein
MLLVNHFVYDLKTVLFRQASCDHRLLELVKCLPFFLLNILQPLDELFLHSFELLRLPFKLID